MMAVSAWNVWRGRQRHDVRIPLALFGAQLALNTAWSMIFFGFRQPGLAAIEIVPLWSIIVATLRSFARISGTAAWLLVPYLAWVSFATALNLSIWRLNS